MTPTTFVLPGAGSSFGLAGRLPHKVQGLGDVKTVTPIILDGKKLDAKIQDAITGQSPLDRTIDGASTLQFTVTDPDRFLLKGGYYERRAELLIDDLWFEMVSMDKSGDDYTVTFEDREVARLRRRKKHRQVARSKMTRAEFAQALVHEEPHIHFVAPELHKKQKIAPHSKDDQKTLVDTKTRGIAAGTPLKVQRAPATAAQIEMMNQTLDEAQKNSAGKRAALAMIVANIQESRYIKTAVNQDSGAKGLFQLLPSTARSTKLDPLNVQATAAYFLNTGFTGAGGAIELAAAHPDWSPGQIALEVEGPGGSPGPYDQWRSEADAIYEAYGTVTDGPPSDGQDTFVQQFLYSRGKPTGPQGEDTWTCIQRLAAEVHWRCFIVAGVVYFISEYDLIRQQPRMTLSESTKGVASIDFDLDVSAKVPDEMTVQARAARWAAPPGTVVLVTEEMGPAQGAWIVSDINRPDLFEDDTTITLTRPHTPLPEPASHVVTRSSDGTPTRDGGVNAGPSQAGPDGALKADSHVLRAFRKAQSIDPKHYPYVFGGGHAVAGQPSGSPPGYDCSGGVSALLHAAGLLAATLPGTHIHLNDQPLSTSGLISWGLAGQGKYMTVWVKETGDPHQSHTVVTFNLPKEGEKMFEAGGGGNNKYPVGFHPVRTDLETSFQPRHWPGT